MKNKKKKCIVYVEKSTYLVVALFMTCRRKTTRIPGETIVTGPAAADEHAARSHGSQAAHESAEKAGDGGDV